MAQIAARTFFHKGTRYLKGDSVPDDVAGEIKAKKVFAPAEEHHSGGDTVDLLGANLGHRGKVARKQVEAEHDVEVPIDPETGAPLYGELTIAKLVGVIQDRGLDLPSSHTKKGQIVEFLEAADAEAMSEDDEDE